MNNIQLCDEAMVLGYVIVFGGFTEHLIWEKMNNSVQRIWSVSYNVSYTKCNIFHTNVAF